MKNEKNVISMRMKVLLYGLFCFMLFHNGQAKKVEKITDPIQPERKPSGDFSLGVRNVNSLFNDGKFDNIGTGVGGQFRIRLSRKVNTEWFLDYITTDISGLANRKDYHIGWSVMYYPILKSGNRSDQKLLPYFAAGHCFDNTVVTEYANITNSVQRFSSAVQMGIGNQFNLTPKLDFTLLAQYMIHLGSDVHTEIETHNGTDHIHIDKTTGFDLEGHILITFSANYKIGKLWGRN